MPSLMATLGLNWSGFRSGVDGATSHARLAGAKMASALGNQIGNRLLGFASGAAIAQVARQTFQYADKVSELADRLGISTDAVQAWDYALKQNGSSIESAASFFDRLAVARKNAMEGNAKTTASFRALGISLDDLKNKRVEDLALQIGRAFESGDPQKLMADLREIGGRGAGEMVTAFRGGLADLVASAKGAGVVISESVIGELSDAADKADAVWMQFVAGIAPALAWLTDKLQAAWRFASKVLAVDLTVLRTGSLKAGREVGAEMDAEFAEQDRLAEERRKASRSGLKGGAEEGEDSRAERAAGKEAAERERLAERLRALQNKNFLETLSKEQQITELHRRRVALANWLAANGSRLSESGRLRAEIDLEELKGEEESAQRGLKGQKQTKRSEIDLNTLQQIGAYTSAYSDGGRTLERTALDVHKKNEGHLAAIRDVLVKGPTAGRGVKF
jgi:hypothetical protein